jgi:hypothetical protein
MFPNGLSVHSMNPIPLAVLRISGGIRGVESWARRIFARMYPIRESRGAPRVAQAPPVTGQAQRRPTPGKPAGFKREKRSDAF